ncbi:cytochrome P450 family protein [Piscinibacter sakaiensis]|uniref:Cytochrome P450 family protein n=1 Tax=Piscinibacter sakaiensis TaxID=1547922 RepID=A0A0K8P7T2_PISS1|nr:cytochrome P450 family protein [Piscinibacter sakaiensis]
MRPAADADADAPANRAAPPDQDPATGPGTAPGHAAADAQPAPAASGGCPHAAAPLFHPAYPQPRANRAGGWRLFFQARHSWLHALFERSYRMKMGEVRLFGHPVYMVNEPAWVRHAMVDAVARYPKHRLLGRALEPLLGRSIFTTNGALWQRQRRMMDPAFAQARMAVAFPRMLQAGQAMLARLQALPDGAEPDMEIEMTHVTADIIFRTILSAPMEGEDARRIFAAFAEFQALAPRLTLPVVYGLGWLAPLIVPFWQVRRSRRAAAEIRGLLGAIIRPRYDARRAADAAAAASAGDTAARADAAPRDILDSLLDARDDAGLPMDFEELLDEVAMLFLAGHETSASALTWALHLLANAPEVQRRLADEVDRVLGDREPGPDDLRELVFTRQVFRETLRLFPPVGFFAREAAEDDRMRDKAVPRGATVTISPWLIHRHREWWSHPDAFDPDRFDTEAGRASLRHAYLPFGLGPRVCIGANFALQEATLLLAMLARQHRVEPVPGHVPEPVGRLTVRSANGVRLRLWRRRPPAAAASEPAQSPAPNPPSP